MAQIGRIWRPPVYDVVGPVNEQLLNIQLSHSTWLDLNPAMQCAVDIYVEI